MSHSDVGDSGESKSANPKEKRGFSEKSQPCPCVLHAFLSMIDKACLPLSRGMESEWKETFAQRIPKINNFFCYFSGYSTNL